MSITWNGVSSDTIGVIVERIPNRYVPTRRFSPQQVAGRNGNILLVDKSFPNVEQEYEVYLSAESQGIPSVARACAEWLMGPTGYCRLTDSYDTTVYREAFLMGGYDLENILNKFGRCTITFSCKPQKYLLTGETPVQIPAGSVTTYTGGVANFTGSVIDEITALSAGISYTQDLHGYSNPWPEGGGVNKLPVTDWFAAGYNETIKGVKFTVNADGSIKVKGTNADSAAADFTLSSFTIPAYRNTFYVAAGDWTISASGVSSSAKVLISGGGNNGFSYKEFSADGSFSSTVTDATKPFNYILIRVPASAVVDTTIYTQLETGTTAHAWAPYSNICPITGATGLSVYCTAKNMIDPEKKSVASGSTTTARWYNDGTGFLLHAGQAYALSSNVSTDATYFVYIYDIGGTQLAYGKWTATYTPTNDAYVYFQYDETGGAHLSDAQLQLELGSTVTSYEDYNGNTYSVDWTTQAGTVYGGTVDLVTGTLTVDKMGVDLGSLSWTKYGSTADYDRYITSGIDSLAKSSSSVVCSIYKARVGSETITANMIWIASGNSKLSATTNVGTYANATNFGNGMSGQILVYELDTPQTYALTPQEIEVLTGPNYIWSNAGSVSVTVSSPLGGVLTNPTPFEARPLLTVTGEGELTVNGKTIQILEAVSNFKIDCETMEADDNSKIYCMDFPELSGGANAVVGSGTITALSVVPRWWTL